MDKSKHCGHVLTLMMRRVSGQRRRRGRLTRMRGRRQLVMSRDARTAKGPDPCRWILSGVVD